MNEPRIINKIVNKTIISKSRSDSKANIIQPVFYRTRDIGSIVIHPEVTENIAINLDAYKSSVDTFILRISGVDFREIGRTSDGVVFRVEGSSLPTKIAEGVAYILNNEGVLVTKGTYTIER